MAIPATVGTGFQLLRALRARDIQAASALTTSGGKKVIAKLLASPTDPRAAAIAGWAGSGQGRVQGTRGMFRFVELPETRVAVLDLFLERGGWRLDDVRIVDRAEYEAFGHLDETSNIAP